MTLKTIKRLDTQVVGLLGKHRLIDEILRAGLEVAEPIRDHGIDLIVYADLESMDTGFAARPVQIKTASIMSFGISKKYEKFPHLLTAYVWFLSKPDDTVTYCMSYKEAITIADKMGYTRTSSWKDKGGYDTTNPSKRLRALIEPYRMTPAKWRERVIK